MQDDNPIAVSTPAFKCPDSKSGCLREQAFDKEMNRAGARTSCPQGRPARFSLNKGLP
jgi:hypothetical protein